MRITFTYKTITNVGLKLLGEMGILFWIMFLYCCLFVMLAVGSRGDIGLSEALSEADALKDYCQKEVFRPRCPNGEVILMKKTIYGRMRTGRCLILDSEEESMTSNPRYLGCFADVTKVLDGKCTGKNTCDVAVLDDSLQKLNPCFKGLVSYMETQYSCVAVYAENSDCRIMARSASTTYILSSSLWHNKCGTATKPLIVEASSGQRIKVGIVNLNNTDWNIICPFSLGHINERTSNKNKEFCIDTEDRHKIIYTSQKNKIEISFEKEKVTAFKRNLNSETFLISIEAEGCSDLIPAEDSWLNRKDDVATVGCYSSRQSWQLKCVGSRWVGVVGNCSAGLTQSANPSDKSSTNVLVSKDGNLEVLGIFAICGAGLAVCGAIVSVGYLCGRRYDQKNSKVFEPKERNQEAGRDMNYYNQQLQIEESNDKDINNYETSAYFVLDEAEVDKRM